MLLFEALKRSLLILHRVRGRLSIALAAVEARHPQGLNFEEQAADALIDAISIVDFLHRYGALVDALPLISKRDAALVKLRAALRDVEAARHYLQHIRGDLTTDAGITYPVLGSVMWSSGIDSYALQFSQATEVNIQLRVELDRRGPPGPQSKLKFCCKNKVAELDSAIAEADATYRWINERVTCNDPSFVELKWGNTLLGVAKGARPPGEASPAESPESAA